MKKSILCLCVLGMVGCSSTKVSEVKIPEGSRSVAQYPVNKIELPEWYVNVPREDNAIYATATEVSSDLQYAIDKAAMSAKREIAFKLSNDFSQKYKEHTSETNYSTQERMAKETERLVIANSVSVNLVGVQRVKSEVIREGNQYRAYMLVRYGLDESNRIHMNYIIKERRANVKTEMDKFDREIKDNRGQSHVEPLTVGPNTEPGTLKPVSQYKPDQLLGPKVSDPEVRAQVLEAYKKPGAVVLQETVR